MAVPELSALRHYSAHSVNEALSGSDLLTDGLDGDMTEHPGITARCLVISLDAIIVLFLMYVYRILESYSSRARLHLQNLLRLAEQCLSHAAKTSI